MFDDSTNKRRGYHYVLYSPAKEPKSGLRKIHYNSLYSKPDNLQLNNWNIEYLENVHTS